MNDQEKHMYCTNKFIELANELRKEDIAIAMVSGSLMTSSCIYATYAAEQHQVVKKAKLQEQTSH